jgi:hypothetical protein
MMGVIGAAPYERAKARRIIPAASGCGGYDFDTSKVDGLLTRQGLTNMAISAARLYGESKLPYFRRA